MYGFGGHESPVGEVSVQRAKDDSRMEVTEGAPDLGESWFR